MEILLELTDGTDNILHVTEAVGVLSSFVRRCSCARYTGFKTPFPTFCMSANAFGSERSIVQYCQFQTQFLWAIFQSQSEMYYDLSSFFSNFLDSFEHLGYI